MTDTLSIYEFTIHSFTYLANLTTKIFLEQTMNKSSTGDRENRHNQALATRKIVTRRDASIEKINKIWAVHFRP